MLFQKVNFVDKFEFDNFREIISRFWEDWDLKAKCSLTLSQACLAL
jgi:hypothetical protein